ncbi:hypothetical protein BDV59DRAFT_12443 [Aspergillus ambiguus]|uniref:uncharacterized protein n=1 Tax=Aspergillus ambiguus TaxID=176160 RepID=UPI003CCD1B5F
MAQQPSRHVLAWIEEQHGETGEAPRIARRAKSKRRSSFDDILRNDPASSGRLPEQIALPESRDGSSTVDDGPDDGIDSEDRYANAAKSSLEMIDRDGTFVLPASIPLPPSPPPPPPPPPPPSQPYRDVLERAANVFDHIKKGNVRKAPRVERTSITLYEFMSVVRPRQWKSGIPKRLPAIETQLMA